MAKNTKTPEEATAAEIRPAKPSLGTVTAVTAALLQSPRFAPRITDAAQQDLVVDIAVSIATKLENATK